MKVYIVVKDPNGVSCSVNAANLTDEQKEQVHQWFKYQEYAQIEIDLDTDTARLVKP